MNRKIGVILSYIAMIFEILSTLLLTPFILSSLGEAEYGVYKLSASLIAYLLLLDLGVGNAVIRFSAKYRANKDEENARKFLGVSTIFYIIIAFIVLVLGIVLILVFPTVFAKGLKPDEIILGQKLLFITTINSAITLGTANYFNILVAYEKFILSKGLVIFGTILKIILTIIVLKLKMGSIGITLIVLLITIITRGLSVLYVLFKLKLKPKFKNIDLSFMKEIIAYSGLILLQMIATQINSSLDQILLGSLVVDSAVIIGIYGVGTQIIQYFQSIGTSFTSILMPGVVQMVEKEASPEELNKEMIKVGRIIFMILGIIFVVFSVYGQQFIILWAGENYKASYIVVLILMFAYLFILIEAIGTQILWAKNMHKELSFIKLGIVLLNIILTVFLIKWNPLIGATIGTFVSLFAGDVVTTNIILKKKIGISLCQYYKGLFKGILISLIITLFCGYAFKYVNLCGWFGFIVNVSVMAIVYIICLFIFGMNNYEKGLIKSILKIKHKNING